MSGMKNGHLPELSAIVLNDQNFFIPYSTSHIGDILASIKDHSEEEQRLINQDLDFIREITKNQCLYNTGEQVLINTIDPGELLDERIRDAPLFTDFSLDSLFSLINEDDPMFGTVSSIKNMLASIPLEETFKEAFEKLGLSSYKEFIHFGLTSQDINNTAAVYFRHQCVCFTL